MVIQVDGNKLPGLRCNPGPDAVPNENINVGIGQRFGSDQLFPGDAPSASWRFDVRVIPLGDDSFDFRGALVSGKRGDRFLYLNWGSVSEDGAFHPFRRAKVDLTAIDSVLVARALEADAELHCTVQLTDAKGNPTCARFRGDQISWRIAERRAPRVTAGSQIPGTRRL
jgi:uncharacterized protein DUF5990